MSRCKNCVFWARFQGDAPTIPKRSAHACVARILEYKGPNGEDKVGVTHLKQVQVQDDTTRTKVTQSTKPSKFYGIRTAPKHTCELVRAKRSPRVKAEVPAIPPPQRN